MEKPRGAQWYVRTIIFSLDTKTGIRQNAAGFDSSEQPRIPRAELHGEIMLGQHDIITYEEPPSAVARRTQEALYQAFKRNSVKLFTAVLPEAPSVNSEMFFSRLWEEYHALKTGANYERESSRGCGMEQSLGSRP